MAVDHYENFPVASLLLPPKWRAPVALIYRFAREADDFADEGSDPPETRLANLGAYQEQLDIIGRGTASSVPASTAFTTNRANEMTTLTMR